MTTPILYDIMFILGGRMDRPTDAQVKEFWEWCGWRQRGLPGETGLFWCVDGDSEAYREAPDIGLNNLFKYAVPKYREKLSYELLFEKWLYYLRKGYNPVLALFWALWKVKEA